MYINIFRNLENLLKSESPWLSQIKSWLQNMKALGLVWPLLWQLGAHPLFALWTPCWLCLIWWTCPPTQAREAPWLLVLPCMAGSPLMLLTPYICGMSLPRSGRCIMKLTKWWRPPKSPCALGARCYLILSMWWRRLWREWHREFAVPESQVCSFLSLVGFNGKLLKPMSFKWGGVESVFGLRE